MVYNTIHLNEVVKKELFHRKLEMIRDKRREITWDEFFINSLKLPLTTIKSGRGNKIKAV